jgi:hypothetical protein
MRAAVASARYSRWREIPSWRSVAAIGPTKIATSAPTAPSGLSSSSPKRDVQKKIFPIAEIAPAIMAAMDETRMSRFLTCANSWASTPRI